MKQNIQYKEFDDTQKCLEFLNTLTEKNVVLEFFKTAAQNSKYYHIFFKIDNVSYKFNTKFKNIDIKLTPQKDTGNGLTKVKGSFALDSELGKISQKINDLVIPVIRSKFDVKLYPTLTNLIQTESVNVAKDTLEKIENPLCWVTLPSKFDKNTMLKNTYGGSIKFVGKTKSEDLLLEYPTFETISSIWKRRAHVTGTMTLDNLLIMGDRKMFLTISINTYRNLIVAPISMKKEDDTEDTEELRKGIVTTVEGEKTSSETEENKVHDISDIDKDDDFDQIY